MCIDDCFWRSLHLISLYYEKLLTVIFSLNHSFNIEKIESFFRAVCVGVQLLWGSRGGMPALTPNQTGLRSSEENVVKYKFTRN